uniref:Uncharacterized protein n=1 Tax=Solanum tuberosum TaxID=4113 RepID=M1DWU7_SOLTU
MKSGWGSNVKLQVCFYRKLCTRAARDRGRRSRAIDAVNAFRALFRIFHSIWERLGAVVYCCPAFCVAACLITWKWKVKGMGRFGDAVGFYCEDNNELVQVTSDTQLLEFVKDLVDSDEFHVYVVHKVDELEELPAPTGLLPWSDPVGESVGINTEETVENDSDLNEVELPGGDTNQNEAESDLPSSDTYVDAIPDEDDSDVDEELRSLRAERRNKKKS